MTGKLGIHSLNKLFLSQQLQLALRMLSRWVLESGKNGILWYYIFSTLVSQMALEYQVKPKHLRLEIEQWCMFWKKIAISARRHKIDRNIHAWGNKSTFPSWETQRTTIWETFITLAGRRKEKKGGNCFWLWGQKCSLLVAFTSFMKWHPAHLRLREWKFVKENVWNRLWRIRELMVEPKI